ncbi:hypothetical protein HID58_013539, partial [Brassica napus]
DWESRLPCVLGPRKSRLSLFSRKQQKLLNKAREMEGVPDLSALLKGRLQLLSKESAPVGPSGVPDSGDQGGSKEGASNSNDEGVSVEPPAPSPKKKKKDKRTTGKSSDETSLPLSASLATSSEGQGTKKKKKKKRTRDEATSRDEATAMDDATPVERPKKKVKKKAAGTEPGSSVVVPSSTDAAREGEVTPNVPLEEKRKALVQRSGSGSESADITSALSERIVVPEGTTIEERPDGSDPEETGGAIQTDTGDVAAEDPVLVSSSEEREEDEVGEEENRSSSVLVEGMVPNLPVSDPPAQVEGLGDQVREEQTIEALDPSRDDQDVVV